MGHNKIYMQTVKFFSNFNFGMDKNYKLYRKCYEIIHPVKVKNLVNYEFVVGTKKVKARFFYPTANYKNLIIFFHGGGWVIGNIDSYHNQCFLLSQKLNSLVISVDYSLAPEHPFPEGLEECYGVVKYITTNHKKYNVKARKIFLMGDSAGANIAASISLMARDKREFKVYNQILLYPVLYNDHSLTSKYDSVRENAYFLTSKLIMDYEKLYVDEKNKNNPYFAPLLMKNLFFQPRTLIITASLDPLRDEGKDYAKRLKRSLNCVKYYNIKNAFHGFFSSSKDKEALNEMYKYINRFLGEDNEKK